MSGRPGRLALAALVFVIALVAAVAAPGQVGAQEPPSAAVEDACDAGEGFILVEIVDEGDSTFDVVIDDELVDEGIPESGDDVYAYGPTDDGTYNVVVVWVETDEVILDTDVTVECAPEVPAPTTTTTTVAPPAAAPAATRAPAPLSLAG